MNNTIKKAAAVFAAAMTILSASAMPAFANNHGDTKWSVYHGASTYSRAKLDASSMYVYNTSKYGVTVSVYGRNGENGTNTDVSWCSGYPRKFVTKGLFVPAGGKRLIHQYVNERKLSYAAITFTGYDSAGWWSPDSIGSYTYAN